MLERLVDRFAAASLVPRRRSATSVLFHGRAALSDRIVTALYFEVAAARWAGLSEDPAHLEQYEQGLARCSEPSLIVDVGTGTGASAAAAARRWPASRVVGIDLSYGMIRKARARHHAPGLEFRRASADALPFADGTVDLVTLLHAVVYPPEVRRIVKPDGRVLSASRLFDYQDFADSDPWVGAGFEIEAHESVGKGHWVLYRPVASGEAD
jgi:SAM-dependent methyltransferase